MNKRLYLKYYLKLIWKTSVPGWAIIFLFCFLFGLLYELLLVEIEAPYKWFVGIGRFSIQLSYGYMAGYIFYFLTVHIPALEKKIHMYRFTHNSIVHLDRVIRTIYEKCPKPVGEFNTAVEIKNWLKTINPLDKYYESLRGGLNPLEYPNFYSFLFSKRVLINSQIQILMNHQDIFSVNTIKNLTHISDAMNKLELFAMFIPGNKDAEILSICLESIPLYMNEINNDLRVGIMEYHRINLMLNKKEMDFVKASFANPSSNSN